MSAATARRIRRPDVGRRPTSLALVILAAAAVASASCGVGPVQPSSSKLGTGASLSGPSAEPNLTPSPAATATVATTRDSTPTPSPAPTSSPRPSPSARLTASPTATPPASGASLPACAYQDVTTTLHAYADWARTLVDTIYRLPATYAPSDLVSTSKAGLTGGYSVRSLVLDDLTAMAEDAMAAGARLGIASAYRSYEAQVSTFDYWVNLAGREAALLASARPGHSEHQLGTTIDFKSYGGSAPWDTPDWSTTPSGAWLAANAWEYGWVMSYPPDSSPALTCYKSEPWHYRYVGRETAAAIHDSGQAPRQWFWEHGSI
jgi:D-alanyl-D-alanine carboxypeptidase